MSVKKFVKVESLIFCLLLAILLQGEGVAAAASGNIQFPSEFQWGVSTAAYQIEGNDTESDIYQWEQSAPNRVISIAILPNLEGRTSLFSASNGVLKDFVKCPIVPRDLDPDPKRTHSALFLIPGRESSAQICEASGKSIDHWNHLAEDTKLLADLHVKTYRFSIAWSKIEPRKGFFDMKAIAHYQKELALLAMHGIHPQITLFHFAMPQWLRAEGGWESDESPALFAAFTKVVYQALGRDVNTWFTLNEPIVHLSAGYLAGVLPPGKTNGAGLWKAANNILRAHALSYQMLHELARAEGHSISVGIAHHLRIFDAENSANPIESIATKFIDYVWNWAFIDAIETGHLIFAADELRKFGIQPPEFLRGLVTEIPYLKGSQDFLGVNYYTRDLIEFKLGGSDFFHSLQRVVNPNAIASGQVSDMNWEIYPQGMYRILKGAEKRVNLFGRRSLPIFISESGIADATDAKRVQYLKSHLAEIAHAMDDGVPVVGFSYWTLIDNFEWNAGYFPKFGLYSVDLKTLERSPRPSASWYSHTIQENGFAP